MQVTIYIRKENEGKWNDIADKSVWVNALLANSGDTEHGVERHTAKTDTKNILEPVVSQFIPRAPDAAKGYPCCEKKTPCKHWQWDSGREAYVNMLTGAFKEPTV